MWPAVHHRHGIEGKTLARRNEDALWVDVRDKRIATAENKQHLPIGCRLATFERALVASDCQDPRQNALLFQVNLEERPRLGSLRGLE